MKIKNIRLRNYRNYENLNVNFCPSINIILGDNAQGKTNLLESILYLSLTRSHRVNQDNFLIKQGCDFACIDGEIVSSINKRLKVVIACNGKSLFVSNKQIQKSSEFIGLVNAILFSPRDIDIFEQSPKSRRKLMDIEIGKINKQYMLALNNYAKLLKERNNLLKMDKGDINLFTSLEELMIKNQIYIIRKRYQFITKINSIIGKYYKILSNSNDECFIEYNSCVNHSNSSEMINEFKDKYQKNYERDLFIKSTSFGIHRDDLIFKLNNNDVCNFASQGQRRMVILAFKLSLIDYIEEMINEKPILLLDDVLSELDLNKRINLFKVIPSDIQTIITTTNLDKELDFNKYRIIKINDGRLMEDKV